MKKHIFFVIIVLVAFLALIPAVAVPAQAAEVAGGTCGESVTWSLDDTGVLTVSGTGAMEDYTFDVEMQGTNAPWYVHNETIKSVVVGEGITYVGEFAFMNLRGVTSVTLPSTLKDIGGHAFQHMGLLTSIVLPEGLEVIGTYSFYGSNFTDLHLPDSLKTVEAFSIYANNVYIDSLEHWLAMDYTADPYGNITGMFFAPGALYIDGELATDIVIPEGTTEIKPYKFYQIASITDISIPESVTQIGEAAFWGCDGLTEVVIPDTVLSIGERLFMECENLTAVKLPADLWGIPAHTFRSCTKLASFTMPENVMSIGNSAFEGCESLTRFSETNSLENVTYIGGYAFVGCKNLQFGELKLSPQLYSLGDGYVFAWCEGITSVTIPGSVHKVDWTNFENCVNLESVVIEEGVTAIGSGAFGNCAKLTTITIPSTVTMIDADAFYNCTALKSIYVIPEGCEIGESSWAPASTLGVAGTTTIYGKIGSTAETYAAAHGYTFVVLPQTCEFGYHSYTSETTKEVTCTENGVRTTTCGTCGGSYEEEILCAGHDVTNGSCQICGMGIVAYGTDAYGTQWVLNTEGVLTLTAEFGGHASSGEPWAEYADQIQEIVLGQNIYALYLGPMDPEDRQDVVYSNLTTIKLNEKVNMFSIRASAPNLKNFVVHENNRYFFVSGGNLYSGSVDGDCGLVYYVGTSQNTSLRLPTSVRSIQSYALNSATNLERIYFFGDYFYPDTFRNCSALTDVYLFTKEYFLPYGPFEDVIDEVKDMFGDPAVVTLHGYKDSFLEEFAAVCGYKFVELTKCDIEGHNQQTVEKIPATCIAEGYSGDTYCADCGVKLASGTLIEKLSHTLTAVEEVPATCVSVGAVAHYKCAVCEKIFAEETATTELATVVTEALGHEWDDGTTVNRVVTYKCRRCDETKTSILPPDDMSVDLSDEDGELADNVLSDEEKQRVEQGETSNIYLEVFDISEVVTEEDKALVAQKLGENKIGLYMDINLYKQLGDDRPIKVTETNGKIKIRINIPAELLNEDVMVRRTYQIIRIHNGDAEVIDGTFNKNNNVFVFETDGFSTYVLVYSDTVLTVPPTGDSKSLLMYNLALVVSLAMVVALITNKKRLLG